MCASLCGYHSVCIIVCLSHCKYYTVSVLGRAEKWKKDILKYAYVDYYGTIYIKQGLIKKDRILKILAGCFYVLKF